MIKFVRPEPVAPAPREKHERLLLMQRLLDPLEAGWRAALSTGDVDRAWAFWTTTAEETLLALACPDITPDSLPAGAALLLAPSHLRRGRGTNQLLREVRLCPKQRQDTESSAFQPCGAHPGGPGTPPGRPPLAGTTSARRGRIGARGTAGMGGSPTSPTQAPRARPGVCGLGARWLARPAGPAGVAPPPSHDVGGKGPGLLGPRDRIHEWRAWLEEAWSSD